MNKYRIRIIAFIIVTSSFVGTSLYAKDIEFNDAILKSLGFEDVDLSAFAGSNDKFTDENRVELVVNGQVIAYEYPVFIVDNGQQMICFTNALADKLALKKEYIKELENAEAHVTDIGACMPIESLDKNVSVDLSLIDSERRVEISIPQKFLGNIDTTWIPPSERDHGITGVILDYNVIWDYSRQREFYAGNRADSNILSYGTAGFNVGRYRFRADYNYTSNNNYDKKLQWTQIYAYTDIDSISSKLYVGEMAFRSNVFDNTRIRGASLFSDESMMPSYLRGYAPQITGVAYGNALVIVKQYGTVIKAIQVPAGPFAISDLPAYISGTVDVEIEEDSGTRRSYQVEIAQVPFMTRKGNFRYNFNIGKISPAYGKNIDSTLISTDGSYGLFNNLSLIGGVQYIVNDEYKAISLGVAINLGEFGALSVDVVKSQTSILGQNGKMAKWVVIVIALIMRNVLHPIQHLILQVIGFLVETLEV